MLFFNSVLPVKELNLLQGELNEKIPPHKKYHRPVVFSIGLFDTGNGQKWDERIREGSIWPDPAGKRNCRSNWVHPDGFRGLKRPFSVGFSAWSEATKTRWRAKKPNFLAWTIQGAGNELTISGHNHCHCGAVPAFGLFQTPQLVQQEKSDFLT